MVIAYSIFGHVERVRGRLVRRLLIQLREQVGGAQGRREGREGSHLTTSVVVTWSGSEIVHSKLPIGDPKLRRRDTASDKDVLYWTPTVSLRDEIARTVEFERQRRPHSVCTLG
jgi:nucleoside-diphosphate-sugar epimerase